MDIEALAIRLKSGSRYQMASLKEGLQLSREPIIPENRPLLYALKPEAGTSPLVSQLEGVTRILI